MTILTRTWAFLLHDSQVNDLLSQVGKNGIHCRDKRDGDQKSDHPLDMGHHQAENTLERFAIELRLKFFFFKVISWHWKSPSPAHLRCASGC